MIEFIVSLPLILYIHTIYISDHPSCGRVQLASGEINVVEPAHTALRRVS